MNTSLTTRTAFAAACVAALVAGATACGTEDGTASARTVSAANQQNSARANQDQYLQRLNSAAEAARQARAEKADAARWAQGYPGPTTSPQVSGDDRRQAIEESRGSSTSTHPPGYDKALPGRS